MEPVKLGQETEKIEYKKSTGELKEAIISIVAILNKHGDGELYFGVNNDGSVIGQEIGKDTLRTVSQAVGNHIKPAIYPDISVKMFGERKTIYVKFHGERQPYLAYNSPRIRVSDEDLYMDQDMYDDLLRLRDDKRKSWESQTSAYTVDDVDKNAFNKYLYKAKKAGRLAFDTEDISIVLKKLDLMNGEYLLNAGAALFCDTGMNELQMAKFASNERLTFTDIRRHTGSIIELADKAEQYVIDAMNWRAEIEGMTRKEIPEIPVEALREAIINAFAHRVIEAAQSVEVAVFKNRIEIYNYGAFPEHVTPEQYIDGNERPVRRNPLIAKTLYFSKDMENFATGLKRISYLCSSAGCSVEFEKKTYGFSVVFYRRKQDDLVMNTQVNTQVSTQVDTQVEVSKITERELKILDFCSEPRSRAEIAEHLGLKSVKSIKKSIDNLLNMQMLEMTIPSKPRSSKQRYTAKTRK
ncbi:MAG: putative DNA binding domain-containing protein [Clostridia bacterium]|nr:putative DNA binding domain-containing protein [Clostridia bacterium]